jgi:hypothetical protein
MNACQSILMMAMKVCKVSVDWFDADQTVFLLMELVGNFQTTLPKSESDALVHLRGRLQMVMTKEPEKRSMRAHEPLYVEVPSSRPTYDGLESGRGYAICRSPSRRLSLTIPAGRIHTEACRTRSDAERHR